MGSICDAGSRAAACRRSDAQGTGQELQRRVGDNFTVRDVRTLGIAAMLVGMFVASEGFAMDFRLASHFIYATGAIEQGDAAKLAKLVDDHDLASGFEDYTVRLNSPGGLVFEGIKIGRIIRGARLETLVYRNDQCASACALAFLGGTRRYATGTGVGRRMEFGAALGFHGFRSSTDSVRLESETLSGSRVVAGLILEYAAEMKSVDLGWLAQTLNVPPAEMLYVRSPVDIAAMSINVEGLPNTVPQDWYLNVCRLVVSDVVPALDRGMVRVSDRGEPISTIKALRNAIVSGRFGEGPVATVAATLSDSDAIDLALGSPFYLDMRKPISDARSVDLERGAGFYYDKCIAVRTKHHVSVILVDQVSHLLLHKSFSENGRIDFRLAMFDKRAPLW